MTKGRKHSEETIALITAKRVAHAEKAATELRDTALAMMRQIDQEVADNAGVYPHNGGALSQNEFYRRLGLDETTIPKRHKSLRDEIETWRKGLATKAATTRTEARRSEAKRVADWNELYDDLLATYRAQELDWQQAKADVNAKELKLQTALGQLAALQGRFDRLDEDNEQLRAALNAATGRKVVSIRKSQPGMSPPAPS